MEVGGGGRSYVRESQYPPLPHLHCRRIARGAGNLGGSGLGEGDDKDYLIWRMYARKYEKMEYGQGDATYIIPSGVEKR